MGPPPVPTYYIRTLYQDMESQQFYLIHRNKHREAAKMRRQRNMVQNNETPEKELNKIEISNLLDAEFKTLVLRMLKEHLNSILKRYSKK